MKLPIIIGAAMLMASSAFAQSPLIQEGCAERGEVVRLLFEEFGETRQSMGFMQGERGISVMEMFASEETGTWTIILSYPNGISCHVADGSYYQNNVVLPEEKPGEDL